MVVLAGSRLAGITDVMKGCMLVQPFENVPHIFTTLRKSSWHLLNMTCIVRLLSSKISSTTALTFGPKRGRPRGALGRNDLHGCSSNRASIAKRTNHRPDRLVIVAD